MSANFRHVCSCKGGKGSPDEYYYNPLKCPLPKAPSMELYCLYGVGIPTERSYYYLNLESEEVDSFAIAPGLLAYAFLDCQISFGQGLLNSPAKLSSCIGIST